MDQRPRFLLVGGIATGALLLLLSLTFQTSRTVAPQEGSEALVLTSPSSEASSSSDTLVLPDPVPSPTPADAETLAAVPDTDDSAAADPSPAPNTRLEPVAELNSASSADGALRSPPPARTTAVLSPRVYSVVAEIQARQLAGQWEEALNELNALYTEFDELNPFEQSTLLNFYTNTLLRLEMYDEAILAFEQMLQVPDVNAAAESRAKRALGDLYSRQGDPASAVRYLNEWVEKFGNEGSTSSTALVQLAISHNALGQYPEGIAALERHIAIRVNANQDVAPEYLALLRTMTAAAANSGTPSTP